LQGILPIGFLVGVTLLSASVSDTATIIDSGSTNRAGFRIEVKRSGLAEMISDQRGKPVQRNLPSTVTQRFYTDLDAAKPISSLPAIHCMKSASFGSSLTIAIGNEQTPDLNCGDGGSAAMRNLIRDVQDIMQLFQ
jgi:hypothetical protein